MRTDSSIVRAILAVVAMLVLEFPVPAAASDIYSDPVYSALRSFAAQLGGDAIVATHSETKPSSFHTLNDQQGGLGNEEGASNFRAGTTVVHEPIQALGGHHPSYDHAELYSHSIIDVSRPKHVSLDGVRNPHSRFENADVRALRDYAQQIVAGPPGPANGIGFRVAGADNALDALRDYLRGNKKADSPPEAAPRVVPDQPRSQAPKQLPSVVEGHRLGSGTCSICHAGQAESFGKTLMGRISKTQPAKFDCENCHGPAAEHVKAGGCAACHGESVSKRTGIPTLAGQKPEYLIPVMKAYIAGQRRHDLMRTMLVGVDEAQLKNIALYYSRQNAAQAQGPLIGDPTAGKGAAALCVGCHGEESGSIYPAWPNLAGQDAQYLVNAIKAYKDGSRNKAIACAGCHGDGGNSRRPGIPSLAGQTPQALVRAMKQYVAGGRKHDLMKAMLSGLSEPELEKIALYYARQTPVRAQTAGTGNPVAGKKVSEDCESCHGENGISDNPKFPNLAGQDVQYLVGAIKAYKAKSRDMAAMQSAVEDLDERAINDVASYYASLAPAPPDLGDADKKASAALPPVLVRNNLVTSLNERTIDNIASYFASLRPVQAGRANDGRDLQGLAMPGLVGKAVLSGGRSLGSIISFRSNDPGRRVEENNAVCLGCHEKGDRTYWNASTHETRGVACTDCHTVMRPVSRKAALKTPVEMETCFQCHKDRRAQVFRSSHMPLREGKMTCSNCHNPHGSATEGMLKEASINDTCYKCHAEKRGPFLFEHAPVRQNCLSCHDPHGTSNDNLLKVSRPRLCAECHGFGHGSLTNGPRTVETFGRSCQNCHTQIHGSNSPSGALLQR